MNRLKLKKAFQSRLLGTPGRTLVKAKKPDTVAVAPERICFVKTRLLVREGHTVKIGTPLFEDKRDPLIKFLSPGSGVVESIRFGKRRVIQEIVIRLSENEQHESFGRFTLKEIEATSRAQIIKHLMAGGLWPLIRQLPFRDYGETGAPFPMLMVSLRPGDMFSPLPGVFLSHEEEAFNFGLCILRKLAETVIVACPEDEIPYLDTVKENITHITRNSYPAGDPGVILHQIKTDASLNSAAYITGQDLIRLGKLLINGRYPVRTIFTLAGTPQKEPVHVLARQGIPIRCLAGQEEKEKTVITQSVFNGFSPPWDTHMGLFENSAVILDKSSQDPFLGWIRPGWKKPTESKTFVSSFIRKPPMPDGDRHGEERACINCGLCDKKCPVDLYPQFIFKAAGADELDEAVRMGLLDCTECGLCSYVCPSKIEVSRTLAAARYDYYKDRL